MLSKIKVLETDDNMRISQNRCYIAKSGVHLEFNRSNEDYYYMTHTHHPVNELHKPSISIVFSSAATHFGKKTVGVLLTGMGRDGVDGLKEIKKRGGLTVAESEESAIIYGMPKVAKEENAAKLILSLSDIKDFLLNLPNQ